MLQAGWIHELIQNAIIRDERQGYRVSIFRKEVTFST